MTTYCITCQHWREVERITGLCQAADVSEDDFQRQLPELRFRFEGIGCPKHTWNGLPEPDPEETGVLLTAEDDRLAQAAYREKVAKRLRDFMKKNVNMISQSQLARKLQVPSGLVSSWLYRYPPTVQHCDAIMNFLEEMEQG